VTRRTSRGAARGIPDQQRERSRPYPDKRRQSGSHITPNRQRGFSSGKRPYDYAFYEKETATKDYMARLFDRHEFSINGDALEKFWRLYSLLRERNAELDLTRIMGIEATILKHYIDSAIVLQYTDIQGPLLDVGSGPGFPGIPVAILRPELPVILAESRGKRVGFLEEAVHVLELNNVFIFPKSVREDSPFCAASEDKTISLQTLKQPIGNGVLWSVHDVITRALEHIAPTLSRIASYMPVGGKALFLKGPQCGQEITEAQETMKGVFKMLSDVHYTLPNSHEHRRLVIFERRE